jgi:hypothetical protein
LPINLFGFTIQRSPQDDDQREMLPSPIAQQNDDGATIVPAGGSHGYLLDLEGAVRTEAELIGRYRDTSLHPEVESAIDDIVNQAIITDQGTPPIMMDLSDLDVDDNLKLMIEQEFERIIDLLYFNNKAYEIFRHWYIDGRIYYQMIIDEQAPENGIQELRNVDAMYLRKVREIARVPDSQGFEDQQIINDYYVYSENGFKNNSQIPVSMINGAGPMIVRMTKDSICNVTSGIQDKNSAMVLSHLHAAIKPLNQLRALEDATIVYRLVRAPERKVFNVDVGGLTPAKANQYLQTIMTKHKNKVTYDQATGEVRDDRRFMTMVEDYWFPKQDGGRGTSVDILRGGDNLGEMTDVEYFQQKLYKALYVPVSRLEPSTGFSIGRPSEITRDELKFMKFVDRLRLQFSQLFFKLLHTQLILRRVIAPDEWHFLEQKIKFNYTQDNYFEQLKQEELLREKATTMSQVAPYVGQFLSRNWVWENVWQMEKDQIKQMVQEMEEDAEWMAQIDAQHQGAVAQAQAEAQ